jgi:hypothetical protein
MASWAQSLHHSLGGGQLPLEVEVVPLEVVPLDVELNPPVPDEVVVLAPVPLLVVMPAPVPLLVPEAPLPPPPWGPTTSILDPQAINSNPLNAALSLYVPPMDQ